MKKRAVLLLVILCVVLCSCGQGGISQEEYDRVVAERDDYKETMPNTSDSLNKAIEELSIFEGLSFSESEGENSKALIITSYLPLSDKEVGTKFEKLGQAISDKKGEEWFCYDFVFIQLWNSESGIITSIETKINSMELRSYQWYDNDEAEKSEKEVESEKTIGSNNIEGNKNEENPSAATQDNTVAERERDITIGKINALRAAKDYLNLMPFSYKGLVEQLEYEQYTHEEATYGADNCGGDWNEQAAKSAESYLSMMSFSKEGLIEQLEYEGFTHEQAVYGVEQNGY